MGEIDINCDLGEGKGNDTLIMPHISSCNIACGGHFGNKSSISSAIKLAAKHNVKVGAHPSFPDKINFGRKLMKMSNNALLHTIVEQISLFKNICNDTGITMHHIKLHGALYNLAAKDKNIACVVLEAIKSICPETSIYAPYESCLAHLASENHKVYYEAFLDRRYTRSLALVPREHKKALIIDPICAWEQMLGILLNQQVKTIEGDNVLIKAETFCIHGDQPHAVEMVKFINTKLEQLQKT